MDTYGISKKYLLALEADFKVIEPIENIDEAVTTLDIDGSQVAVVRYKDFRPHHLKVAQDWAEIYNNLLIVSDYITPNAKKRLREQHLNYVDSYGNGYLQLGEKKVYIEKGNGKPVFNEFSKVFTQSGGQLLYQLFQNPDRVNDTYRSLAACGNVSLGSVSKFFKGLQEEGYIIEWDKTKKYELVKREELLEKWIQVVNEKVLPANKVGRYAFTNNRSDWKKLTENTIGKWGGEPGAAILTSQLSPEHFTLFTAAPQSEILKKLRLVPSDHGEIVIYNSFWQGEEAFTDTLSFYNESTVHPLLIYAQLIYSGNDRNLETAKILYDEYIAPNI